MSYTETKIFLARNASLTDLYGLQIASRQFSLNDLSSSSMYWAMKESPSKLIDLLPSTFCTVFMSFF